jgi:hypothetical protein
MIRGIAVGIAGVLVSLAGAVVMSSGTGCSDMPVDVDHVAKIETTIAGYSGGQLVNAAIIMNVASARGMGQSAQIIGVTAAIAQTDLRNITTTEGTTALGLFAQTAQWGSAEARLDPARGALLFYAQLERVPSWQTSTPAAAATQATGDGDVDYTAALRPATEIVSALSPTQGQGCQVPGDSQALALELVQHIDQGTLAAMPYPEQQIRWIAGGQTVSDCGIDVRVLQVIVLATRHFDRVGVSSINRLCNRDEAGTAGSHVRGGGGSAVDFYMLDARSLTGADGLSLRFIGMLDPVVSAGARVGQSNCRTDHGVALSLQNFNQVADRCNHLHVDFASTSGPSSLG